ncbi:MAG TPA: efflux RND transporter periplasmic adaptor subunit [Noviherbaspirillum sp.]|jgi:RND family efflux transporter MFP subunit|uniref:efflux RND transporter periplasmic adaptor subunit n=1 Tax=Noviherbaspirillum sp. TaxID=1926288 RepID=UPI002DDCB8A3|nr:efflux RND transporter periplasmic adaptor subunit [Noviherbaspirillum sp.]HEV2612891.1 efflux RND transporter periplasmic adaptor subunit [Noviherbaspirillum sp.]
MKTLKRKPVIIALIVIAILCAIGIAMFTGKPAAKEEKQVAAPRPALTVTTARPSQASLPIRLSANGNIAAWQEAIIGSESNGLRLVEVRASIGDMVKAGQVLAVFSNETVQADVAQAKAALLEAEANAADAANNAARARTLQTTGALSTQQINQYLTTEQTAKAKVEAAKATLAAQQLRLKQTKLLAPDDGIISSRTATVGAVVGAGTELFRMVRQGRLEWRAEVTASELGRLKTGTLVKVVAANGTELNGKVRMVAPTVDPQNRSALVYVDLPNASDKAAPAKSGMFGKGEFDLGVSNALTVPQQSVVIRDGFSYVFRLNDDSRVTQVKVQTGRRLGDRVEILDGISQDATLVASGAGFLNEGDLVKVVQGNAPTLPASASGTAVTTVTK